MKWQATLKALETIGMLLLLAALPFAVSRMIELLPLAPR
jgi:hypothetical protein